MPLLRIDGEHIERAGIDYTTPHMFAGSILDLQIGTEYEARFTLADPDGVGGKGRVKLPGSGFRLQWFIKYQGRLVRSGEDVVKPGDIIKIHGGLYQAYATP